MSTSRRRRISLPRLSAHARKAVYFVHLWVGLTLGLYIVMMGVTGSLLVFMEELDVRFNPHLHRVSAGGARVSLERAYAPIQRLYPNERLQRVILAAGPSGTHEFMIAAGKWGPGPMLRQFYVNPYTGELLGPERPRYGKFFNIVFYLHMDLLLLNKELARKLNGWGALLGTGLLLSGVWLWWPSHRKQLKTRLSVQRGASYRRRIHDLHNVFGIYTLPVLLLAFATGILMMFPDPVRNVVYRLTSTPTPPAKAKTRDEAKPVAAAQSRAKPLPMDDLLRIAGTALPEARITRIYPPKKEGEPFRFVGELAGSGPAGGFVQVKVHPASGRILQVKDPRQASRGDKVLRWIGPLHFGTWGGVWVKLLYVIAGLAPVGLFATGFLKWRVKWEGRRRNRARRGALALPEGPYQEPIGLGSAASTAVNADPVPADREPALPSCPSV